MIGELIGLSIWRVIAIALIFITTILGGYSSYQYIKINRLESQIVVLEKRLERRTEDLIRVYVGASDQNEILKNYSSKILDLCKDLIRGMDEEEENDKEN